MYSIKVVIPLTLCILHPMTCPEDELPIVCKGSGPFRKKILEETMQTQLYSVYLTPSTVDLRDFEDKNFGEARLISSYPCYQTALDFAAKLAQEKHLLLRVFVASKGFFQTVLYDAG